MTEWAANVANIGVAKEEKCGSAEKMNGEVSDEANNVAVNNKT